MNNDRLRVIITGATGMVGEGVLHECLQHPAVEAVLILNRKPLGLSHPKLREVVHPDFYDLSAVESQLTGYNACFFCLGVSSVGMSAEEYYKVTYTLTLHVAETLSRLNNPPAAAAAASASAPAAPPTGMVFSYVSGAGTDSSEKGRSRWARVKGKTENDLMKLPFRRVYAFRPGFIKPIKGLRHAHAFYKYINWLFPLGRALYPEGFVTLVELGLAMIHLALRCDGDAIVTGKDIIRYAAANSSAAH
jgi:nucleoside-diphosphate-sugar epimerase